MPERHPYGQGGPYGQDGRYGQEGPYGRGPARPARPELTIGLLLSGLVFGLMLPAVVAGLIAYIVGGPWPAVWWGGGTFFVLFFVFSVVGMRQGR